MSREHTVFAKQDRRDFCCKLTRERRDNKWYTIFATTVRKKTQASTPGLSPENCVLQIWARCPCHRCREFWFLLQENGEARQTLELQSRLSSCACTLRRERGKRTAYGSNILQQHGTMTQPIDKKNNWTHKYRVFRHIGGVYTIIGAFCQKTQARATLPIG